MAGRLADKIGVITGVASGIGRATALLFLREGATVIGCDIASDDAEAAAARMRNEGHLPHIVHPVDVTSPQDVREFIEQIRATHGRIDCLVNAAATARFARLERISYEREWRPTLMSEADSVFLMVRAAWPLLACRGGSIINFASTAALRAQNSDGGIAHSAAKGAVLAMSRVMAFEGAEHLIRCNTISPGFVSTAATAAVINSPLGRGLVEQRTMLKRIGQPEDIAWCCVYLASDEASWVTGANFTIDGGMMAC